MKSFNNFEKAALQTPDISLCFKQGLKALRSNSIRVKSKNTKLIEGSVDLDGCLKQIKEYKNSNRWDYIISYNETLFFVEVHSVKTSETELVFKKLDWLLKWLEEKAPEIKLLHNKNRQPYYWIATNRVSILKTSSHYKRIIQKGLRIASILELS